MKYNVQNEVIKNQKYISSMDEFYNKYLNGSDVDNDE